MKLKTSKAFQMRLPSSLPCETNLGLGELQKCIVLSVLPVFSIHPCCLWRKTHMTVWPWREFSEECILMGSSSLQLTNQCKNYSNHRFMMGEKSKLLNWFSLLLKVMKQLLKEWRIPWKWSLHLCTCSKMS